MKELQISKVWVDNEYVYAETKDGIQAKYAFADWDRLANATTEQRNDFQLSYFGIHWPQINEDLSFTGMFKDNNYENILREDLTAYYSK